MSSRPRKWRFRLRHIIEAVGRIHEYSGKMSFTEFSADQRTVDAVLRNLEIIGEAVQHVPDAIIAAHPEVPWSDMRAMRNVVAHDYDRVNLRTVWGAIHRDLPPLVPLLQAVLEETEGSEEG